MEANVPPISTDIITKIYEIKDDIHTYWIQMKTKENTLIITIKKEGTIPRKTYENTFTFEALVKKNRWFKMFSFLSEAISELSFSFEEKGFQIKEEEKKIKLTLQILAREQKEFTLEISEINTNQDEIINDCCHSINQLSKNVSSILERISYLEEITYETCVGLLKEEDTKLIEKLLCDPIKEKIKYDLLYRASRCNGDSKIFHDFCDNKGPTITIIKTHNNHIFGGYTSKNWNVSVSNYIADDKAFLFSRNLQNIFPIKTTGNAIYSGPDYGPIFGNGHDIYLSHNCCLNKSSYTNLTGYSDGSAVYVLNWGQKFFYVIDYEVYLITISKLDK